MTRAKEMRDLPLAIDVTASGNVGIGTTPSTKFHVKAGTNQNFNVFGPNVFSTGVTLGATTDGFGAFAEMEQRATQFVFHNGTTERMRIDSSGNVGIGTTNPQQLLHVSANNPGGKIRLEMGQAGVANNDVTGEIQFYHNDSSGAGVNADIKGICTNSVGAGALIFGTGTTSTTERMRINSAGIDVSGSVTADSQVKVMGSNASSVAFSVGDAGTGFYNAGSNAIALSSNGTPSIWVTSGGNIGIGNETNPDCKLHIRGAASGGGRILIQTDGAFAGTDEAILDFRHYDDTGSPSGRISLKGTTNYAGDMLFKVRAGGTSGGGGAGLQEKMRITHGGRIEFQSYAASGAAAVGIQPQRFDWRNENNAGVMARIAVYREQDAYAPGALTFHTSSNVDTSANGGDGDITERMRINSAGNVGIGSDNPQDQLHVYGGGSKYLRIENGSGGNMGGIYLKTADNSDLSKYFRQQAYYTEIGAHNNEGVRFDFQGTRRYTFRGSNGGNVCYNAQNSSNWNTTSDERIKTNIKTLEDGAIDKIKALRPVTFDYTDEWAEHKDLHKITNAPGETEAEHYNITDHGIDEEKQKGQIGWIAQEYKTVFPNDVIIDEDTVGETKYDDFHTLNPESVVPTLVKALQEAVAKIDALETRIKTLES